MLLPARCDPEGSTPPGYPPPARKQAVRHRHATTPSSDTCAPQQLPASPPEPGGRCRTTTRASFSFPVAEGPIRLLAPRSEGGIRAGEGKGEAKERFLLFRPNHSAFPKETITFPVSPRATFLFFFFFHRAPRLRLPKMAAAAEAKPSASASAIFPFLVSRCPRSREPEASAAAAAAGSIRGAAAASDPAPAWWRPLAPSSPRRSTADPPAAAGEHARLLAAAPLPPLLASFSRACGWDGSSNSCGSREEKRVRACVLPLPAPVCFRSACLLRSRCFLPPAARYSSQVCSRGFNPTSGAPLFQQIGRAHV